VRQILDHTTHTVTVEDEAGQPVAQETVHTVNYIDHTGALKGLTFPAPGTDISGDAEEAPRIVGQDVQAYTFATPEEAVVAYEHGEVV
jgi:hypothetical protein